MTYYYKYLWQVILHISKKKTVKLSTIKNDIFMFFLFSYSLNYVIIYAYLDRF
jgi:hypothetical protein